MKLWVDDERPAPPGWVPARTLAVAMDYLSYGLVDEMSLDHDLGGDETTRRIVLTLAEVPAMWPKVIHVHTANPVGREWLVGMIERYGPGVSP